MRCNKCGIYHTQQPVYYITCERDTIAGSSCGCVSLQKCVLTTLLSCLTQPAGVTAVSKPSIGTAYLYSVLIFVFPLIGAIALVHSNRVAIQVQIRLRAQLTSAVYLKALRLSSRCSST